MHDGILKYDLLTSAEKKEVSDFIEFLFSRKKKAERKGDSYREKILNVSVWSEDDVKVFATNKTMFNEWKPETW